MSLSTSLHMCREQQGWPLVSYSLPKTRFPIAPSSHKLHHYCTWFLYFLHDLYALFISHAPPPPLSSCLVSICCPSVFPFYWIHYPSKASGTEEGAESRWRLEGLPVNRTLHRSKITLMFMVQNPCNIRSYCGSQLTMVHITLFAVCYTLTK